MSQAIIRQTSTIAATFSETPPEPIRKWLKAQGYTYKNGQWYKSQTVSHVVDAEESTRYMAA